MSPEQRVRINNEWMRRFTEESDSFEHQWLTVTRFLQEQAGGREPSYGETVVAYEDRLFAELYGE